MILQNEGTITKENQITNDAALFEQYTRKKHNVTPKELEQIKKDKHIKELEIANNILEISRFGYYKHKEPKHIKMNIQN